MAILSSEIFNETVDKATQFLYPLIWQEWYKLDV